jgi:hypothetical protein
VSNAERQKRYREKKAGKTTKVVPVPKVTVTPSEKPSALANAARLAALEAKVTALEVAAALSKALEPRLQALEDRQNPEVYYPPKPTITELRQRVATVTGPKPPTWTEDPGDAP